MPNRPIVVCVLLAIACRANAEEWLTTGVHDQMRVSSLDWPWWRGSFRSGTAFAGQAPPTEWSEEQNVVWKVAVPGRGHGSPIVVGDRVVLATADRKRDLQSVLCLDRSTGQQKWETVVHRAGLMKKNEKASQASSSLAWDGERFIANFLNDGAVYTTALDAHGEQDWQTRVSDYVIHQGYASSPAIYQHLVIVSADNKGGGAVVGMDRATGELVWRHQRPKLPNYASPTIVRACGQDQLIFIGCLLVTSLDPLTGQVNWEIDGATEECVTSTVTDGTHVFSSGGWPDNHVSAIKADGSGEVVWRNRTRVYVPSMVIKDGFLYGILDAGVATCWKADTGQEMWKSRLGGVFSSSPVLVGDLIFVTNETGETFVFKASEKKFHLVAKNQLGDSVFATPAICGDQIFARIAHSDGDVRQEFLYCLGE